MYSKFSPYSLFILKLKHKTDDTGRIIIKEIKDIDAQYHRNASQNSTCVGLRLLSKVSQILLELREV